MKTLKKIIFWTVLTPIITISMWIHEAYKLYYFKQTLARCMKPSEKSSQTTQDSDSNRNYADTKSK